MPTSMYVESPASPFNRLQPLLDGSVNVNTTNPVTSVTVSGAVSVSNLPSTQTVAGSVSITGPVTVTGTVATTTPIPLPADVVSGSRTTTGTLYTVPAGRMFKGAVSISACVAVAGASIPTIGTAAGTIHSVTLNGLALSSITSANTISDVYIWGGASGTAVTFTQGAAGTSTGQIAGILM